eukprot:SAG22_NODE_192_length_15668_cov_4.492389_6_plen_184_part_00
MSRCKGDGRPQDEVNAELLTHYGRSVVRVKAMQPWLENASDEFKLGVASRIAADTQMRRASEEDLRESQARPGVEAQLRRQLHPNVPVAAESKAAPPPAALVDQVRPDQETLGAFEDRLRRGDFVTMRKLKTKVHAIRAVIRMGGLQGIAAQAQGNDSAAADAAGDGAGGGGGAGGEAQTAGS